MIKILATSFIFMLVASTAMAESSPVGKWSRGDGKAIVRIARCGQALCAVNIWIAAGTSGEHVGDRLIMNITEENASIYSGTANDPQRNLSYSLQMTVAEREMSTRGCVLLGMACKNMAWKRIGADN